VKNAVAADSVAVVVTARAVVVAEAVVTTVTAVDAETTIAPAADKNAAGNNLKIKTPVFWREFLIQVRQVTRNVSEQSDKTIERNNQP
jgi:uncharacterized membrane protein